MSSQCLYVIERSVSQNWSFTKFLALALCLSQFSRLPVKTKCIKDFDNHPPNLMNLSFMCFLGLWIVLQFCFKPVSTSAYFIFLAEKGCDFALGCWGDGMAFTHHHVRLLIERALGYSVTLQYASSLTAASVDFLPDLVSC